MQSTHLFNISNGFIPLAVVAYTKPSHTYHLISETEFKVEQTQQKNTHIISNQFSLWFDI